MYFHSLNWNECIDDMRGVLQRYQGMGIPSHAFLWILQITYMDNTSLRITPFCQRRSRPMPERERERSLVLLLSIILILNYLHCSTLSWIWIKYWRSLGEIVLYLEQRRSKEEWYKGFLIFVYNSEDFPLSWVLLQARAKLWGKWDSAGWIPT